MKVRPFARGGLKIRKLLITKITEINLTKRVFSRCVTWPINSRIGQKRRFFVYWLIQTRNLLSQGIVRCQK
jgi:hypothetical protein